MGYKCDHCKDTGWCTSKDTGWCTSKVLEDGTEIKVMCYCHPLVQAGKAKALDGDSALRRLKRKKKGRYELPEGE